MSIEEKRQALDDLCYQHFCEDTDCPLAVPGHKCGCGFTFLTKSGEYGYMTDEEITAAYDVAFPKPDPKPTETKPIETVNHPKHYGREGAMECIDEMVLVFGTEATKNFCLLNAWKYRYRAGAKGGDEDLRKSDWYMAKYAELKGGD